jgi:hypothetical protein
MTISWDCAYWIREKSQMYDTRQSSQGRNIIPIAYVIIMQVKEF